MLQNEDKDVCSQNKEKRTGKKRMRKIKGVILNITNLFQNKVKNVIKDFYKATTFFQKYVIIVTQNNRRAGFVLFPAGNPVCERRGFG